MYKQIAIPGVQEFTSCSSGDVTQHAVSSANFSTFSHSNLKSAGLANAYMDSQIWMQYSTNHVSTTALLLTQNSLRSNRRAFIIDLGELLLPNHGMWIRFVPDATEPCTESTTMYTCCHLIGPLYCGATWASHLLQRYRDLRYRSSTNQMKPSNWCNWFWQCCFS